MTFLFTDIEGSTRLLRRHGAAFTAMLSAHRNHIRAAVERHHGVEIRTEGDLFFVAFRDCRDALEACVDAQRALGGDDLLTQAGLTVRMGLHVGEVEIHDGDYVALCVHQAARIAAAAHGGQVLVSPEIVASAHPLPNGVAMRSLGTFRLKDFDEPVELLQVVHADLDRQFPPIRAAPGSAHNLARRRTSFVGRETEMASLQRSIARAQLVTLTGAGGAGKTRLAQEFALSVASSFADGIYQAELSKATDRAGVWAEVARVTDAGGALGEPLDAAVPRILAGRTMLLVLDNCEHVLGEAAELVDSLLSACPGLVILATSRERLAVEGEAIIPVEPLAPPTDQDDLAANAAVQLFSDRASAANAIFDAEGRSAKVAAICRRLDGLPLAIELAAAQLSVLSLDQLDKRIEESVTALTGGLRTAHPRQQTLLALMQWSYGLLDPDQQRAWRWLSVFAGEFDLDTAGAVWVANGGRGEAPVLDLVMKSLLFEDEFGFRFLETLRSYGREMLAEAGEIESAYRAHLTWIDQVAAQGPDETDASYFRRIAAIFPEMRAALTWASANGLGDLLMSVCVKAGRFLAEAQFLAGRNYMQAALELADDAAVADRGYLLARLAYMKMMISTTRPDEREDIDDAIAMANDACALFARAEDGAGHCEALIILSSIACEAGRYEMARDASTQAADLARAHKLDNHLWRAEYTRAYAALVSGDTAEAGRLFESTGRLTDDTFLKAWSTLSLVEATVTGGVAEGMLARLQGALPALAEAGVHRMVVEAIVLAGCALALEHRPHDAATLFSAAERAFAELGLGDASHWHHVLVHAQRVTDCLELTLASLGEEQHLAAAEAGHRLDLGRAVAYVLQLPTT